MSEAIYEQFPCILKIPEMIAPWTVVLTEPMEKEPVVLLGTGKQPIKLKQ